MSSDTVKVNARAPARALGRVGPYELIREIGHGGMGTVYLARDTKLGRRVAIKFLGAAGDAVGQRFLAEARATARCVHENIVVIHAVDAIEGQPYIVLEYLEGRTLRQLVEGPRLSPARAVDLVVPIVRALVCAHELGVVHRDLKPENVLVTHAGVVKVVDFGIAQSRGDDDETDDDGEHVGTHLYMSPEQWGADEVDARTDLWSVGLILFELIAGRHPLAPATRDALVGAATRLDVPMPSLRSIEPAIDTDLDRVVARCLAKRKQDRFASAAELLAALEPHMPRAIAKGAQEVQPYPGLAAFREEDADLFFGRGTEVARMIAAIEERPLLAAVGPSGAGKSSLVRAGLVPALKRREPWDVAVTRPGRHPLEAFGLAIQSLDGAECTAAVLARQPGEAGERLRGHAKKRGSRVLLVVDQFEELYTLVDDPDVRRAYLAALQGAADDAVSPVRVVLSIRSDFLDRMAQDRAFTEQVMPGIVFVAQTDPRGLRDALVEPARAVGYRFESDELVDEMIGELSATHGALPLLQFAAARLWQERDRDARVLTRTAYLKIGGVAGALASHADAVIGALPRSAQDVARKVLLRLVTPERTRDVVEVAELEQLSSDSDAVRGILDQLVAARLVAIRSGTGAATAELVHESLIARWPALRAWLEQSGEDAAFLARLRTAARQWDEAHRSAGLLWRGEPERDARRWARGYAGELGPRERAYLEAVFRQADRSTRARRLAVAGTIAALALLVVAGGVALVWIRDAQHQAVREADHAKAEAQKAEEANAQLRAEQERQAQLVDKLEKETAATQAARTAEAQATTQVVQSRAALEKSNTQLRASVVHAESESQHAREESERARTAAEQALQAQHAADEERIRAEELARKERERLEKRGRINTSLP